MKLLAHKYHENQFRKGEEHLPYIVHPESVVNTLLSWGESPDSPAIPAAWGHDLLEDTKVTEEEILAVSDEKVLAAIKLLTRPRKMQKSLYMQNIAKNGSREVLLVKIADRICNTRDFIKLKGKLHAFQYLHVADCLLPALNKLSPDPVAVRALKEWEELESSLKEESRLDAVRGCLLGGAAGDALGAPVEFMSKESIKRKYGPGGIREYVEFPGGEGAITDDTQMTLFTAEGLLRAKVRGVERGICAPVSVVHFAYLRWLKTQGIEPDCDSTLLNSGKLIEHEELFSRRAPGNTCLSALEYGAPRAVNNSKGCGSVMRMAPVGLFLAPDEAFHYGCEFSALTHGHPTAITAGGAFAMLIACLREGKSLELSLDLTEKHLEKLPESKETLAALRKARSAAHIEELGEGWVAEEALAIAVFCALKHTWDFAAGVIEAVNITGDSDSTGAMTGNILGVLNGEKKIPQNWMKNLREYALVSSMADDLSCGIEKTPYGYATPEWEKKYPGY